MKNLYSLLLSLLIVFCHIATNAQETINGGFELSDNKGMPRNWVSDDGNGKFAIGISKHVFRAGTQSLQLDGSKSGADKKKVGVAGSRYGATSSTIVRSIQVTGWIKTNEVIDSTVSLFIQGVNGAKTVYAYDQGLINNGWRKLSLTYNPSAEETWVGFYYGIETKSNGIVWLDDLSLVVDGVEIIDPKSLYEEPDAKSLKWLAANLSELRSFDASSSFKDLLPIGTAIKKARIVGLGEPTHGTSEAGRFKIRLMEYLIKEKGFTTIALEEAISTCDQMNRLLNLPLAALKDSLLSMPFYKLWKTEELLGLFTWIHNYNLSNQVKVRFIGIDSEDFGLKNSRKMLRDYGRLHSGEILAQTAILDKSLEDLLKLSRNGMEDPTTLEAGNRLKQHISSLDSLILEEGKKTGNQGHTFQLRSYARVCRQWLETRFFRGNRDEYMADNMSIFLESHPEDKVLLWAHNAHIANGTLDGQKIMGAFLKERFSIDYFPISITSAGGTYMAAENYAQKKWLSYSIEPAYRGTYEYILAKVKPDNYFLNLLNVKQSSGSSWLDTSMRQLDMGYVFENEDDYKYFGTLKKAFDGLVFLRQTSASKSLLK
ncbi:erythromycin esterase family protein [Pedobacter sp. PLR]|uniref:erythromycin esterase family protein n=1 Tax=Pedobacter sp. PLR TaxID=2994465 RepID=UPI002246D589|nr:erythromycin esterase family protein [Pedobacter sp. PLR]MCX2451590.1 erythromycin esterase family protein [Pedobacter sp. PLR]